MPISYNTIRIYNVCIRTTTVIYNDDSQILVYKHLLGNGEGYG